MFIIGEPMALRSSYDPMSVSRTQEALSRHPTTIFLYGPPGPLLDWVAWSFATTAHGGYRWSEVRSREDPTDPEGPVARKAVPPELLSVRDPRDVAPDHGPANAAITAAVRPDGHSLELERLTDFLRLPAPTKALIGSTTPGAPPLVLVISNGHRLLPQFTAQTVRSTIQVLTSHGITVIDVFPQAPSTARFIFNNVWRLDGSSIENWRTTKLIVEQAEESGPLPSGREATLGEIEAVATTLQHALGPSS